jgi:hypothetical protein
MSTASLCVELNVVLDEVHDLEKVLLGEAKVAVEVNIVVVSDPQDSRHPDVASALDFAIPVAIPFLVKDFLKVVIFVVSVALGAFLRIKVVELVVLVFVAAI